ncbi:MAG: hypothetical protein DRH03_06710 [Deltaproteobacteria bacterium]|nr:MAG: hypothetical protein DRH03_06710 [Deltaproteobacteria bacterium]
MPEIIMPEDIKIDPQALELYLIFHSIHNVMLAEELLLDADIQVDMIPVPRELSSDCGMSLACRLSDLDKIRVNLGKVTFTSEVMIYRCKKGDAKCAGDFQLLLTV